MVDFVFDKRSAWCRSTPTRGRTCRELKRVVIDPNVLLSALVGKPDAAPVLLLDAV
jgi:hypothetical protein